MVGVQSVRRCNDARIESANRVLTAPITFYQLRRVALGTGTAGPCGRATLVRPCKCATWRQFYLTRNPLFRRATKDEQLFDWLLSEKQMKTLMRIINLLD